MSSSQTEPPNTPKQDDMAPNTAPAGRNGNSKGPSSSAIDESMDFLEHSSTSGGGPGIGGGNGESGDQDNSQNGSSQSPPRETIHVPDRTNGVPQTPPALISEEIPSDIGTMQFDDALASHTREQSGANESKG